MKFVLEIAGLLALLIGAHLIAGYVDHKAEQARIHERVLWHKGVM